MTLAPLAGFVVGVTADRRAAEQAELLRRRGAEVVHGPSIATRYLVDDDALRRATDAVLRSRPAYLVATTGIGMRAWFEAAQSWGLGEALPAAFARTRVIARGAKAASAVQAAGLQVWRTAPGERLAAAVELVAAGPGSVPGPVVLQCHGGEHATAMAALRRTGRTVLDVPVYRWEPPDDRAPAVRLIEAAVDGRLDAITFTSAPAVRLFFEAAEEVGCRPALVRALADAVVPVCVGPVCAEAARAEGVLRPLAPDPGRLGSMVRVLTDALADRRRTWLVDGVDVVWQGRILVVDGAGRRLSPQEHVVLRALVARPGVVVPRHKVPQWAVPRLRRALGRAGGAVQTVPRRGYRFTAEEKRVPSAACPTSFLSPTASSSPAIVATTSTSGSSKSASCSSAPRSPTSPPT